MQCIEDFSTICLHVILKARTQNAMLGKPQIKLLRKSGTLLHGPSMVVVGLLVWYTKVWDEITYPFPKFSGRKWIGYFIQHFIMDVIIDPC